MKRKVSRTGTFLTTVLFLIAMLLISGCSSPLSPRDRLQTMPSATPIPPDKSELMQIFSKQEDAAYRADYQVTSETYGKKEEFTMTKYVIGAEYARYDIKDNKQDKTLRIIRTRNEEHVCERTAQGWSCEQTDMMMTDQQAIELDAQENLASYAVEETEPRTIAGVSARCYRITAAAGTVEYCYSPEHVPLLIATRTIAGNTLMRASAYHVGATAADFAIPKRDEAGNANEGTSQDTNQNAHNAEPLIGSTKSEENSDGNNNGNAKGADPATPSQNAGTPQETPNIQESATDQSPSFIIE